MLRQPWLPAAILVVGAAVGLSWANRDGAGYHHFWEQRFALDLALLQIDLSLHGWVNDALMTLFFLRAGVEIKREVVRGEFRSAKAAALPALAALGGMVVPIFVYLAITTGGDGESRAGWAVPVATDVAFALGVLALAGRHVPAHLKLFLLTMAIADDVGGILIIAIVFTKTFAWLPLLAAAACVGLIFLMRAVRIDHPIAYVPVCAFMWYCTLLSGVHATIAGVVAGVLVPGVTMRGVDVIQRVDRGLRPIVVFLVFPLFAIANTGIVLNGELSDALESRVFWGVGLGLVVGKTLGITMFTWLAVRLGIGRLPSGVGMRHVPAVAALGGIGFTVAIFIADLSFETPRSLGEAKLAILAGSLAASCVGLLWLRGLAKSRDQRQLR